MKLLPLLGAALLALSPALARGEELYFTIQAGSYPSQESASHNYTLIAAKLPGEFKKNLRLELVKPYYTIRLGQAAKAEELKPLLAAVKAVVPAATTIKAYIRPERIVKSAADGAGESKPQAAAKPAPAATGKETAPKKSAILIAMGAGDSRYLGKGFYDAEQNVREPRNTFRWSSASGELILPAASKITFHLYSWRPPQANPALLTVSINDQVMPLRTEKLTNNEELVIVNVPPALEKEGKELRVTIACHPFSMKQLGLSEDTRNLGVPLSRIVLE